MVVLWDLAKPEEGQLVAQLPNSIYALHHHVSSDWLIAGHNYDGVHVLDWKSRKEVYSIQLTDSSIFDIQSFGNQVLVATGDGSVVVIDLISRAIVQRIAASTQSARAIALNVPSGEYAVGYSDYSIRVFDMETHRLKKAWVAHLNSVFTLQYTADGRQLISGSRDARLKFWDATGDYGLSQEIPAHLYAINHIAFSPDNKHFVTCSLDKSIKVWEASSGKLLKVIDKARHAGHGTSVNKLLWTSFNNQLASASDDRTISIWEIFF